MTTVLLTGDVRPVRPWPRHEADGAAPLAAALWQRIGQADMVLTNVETPLTDVEAPAEKFIAFRSDPSLAASVKAAGFDVGSLANNHTLDQGPEGLFDTLAHLDGAGVRTVGAGAGIEAASAPVYETTENTTVGFIGLSSTLPPGSVAGPGRPGQAPIRVRTTIETGPVAEQPGTSPYVHTEAYEGDVERAEAAVRRTAEHCDFLVLAVHWGVPPTWRAPFQGPLADYQRPLGERLLAAGADVIAGHHPHVIHGVERRSDGAIFYSLGNLLFQWETDAAYPDLAGPAPPYQTDYIKNDANRDTVIVEVALDDGGAEAGRDGEGAADGAFAAASGTISILPVRLDEEGNPSFATGESGDGILARLSGFSRRLDTELQLGEEKAAGERLPVARLSL